MARRWVIDLKWQIIHVGIFIFLHWNIYFTANQKQEIKGVFADEGGFPGIIGLIDGTHIRIRAPEHEPEAYVNRKKFHSFNVQVDDVAKKKLNKTKTSSATPLIIV